MRGGVLAIGIHHRQISASGRPCTPFYRCPVAHAVGVGDAAAVQTIAQSGCIVIGAVIDNEDLGLGKRLFEVWEQAFQAARLIQRRQDRRWRLPCRG